MIEDDLKSFCDEAIQMGVTKAKVISTKDVFTANWVRLKCQFGCSGYGECLMCPPHSPTPEMTQKILNEYSRAILLYFDPNSAANTIEWSQFHDIAPKLERTLFLANYYKAFAFSCGPCDHCSKCNLKRCVHPEFARPSMEASGIDVYATVRKAGFPINVVTSEDDHPHYYSLILIE